MFFLSRLYRHPAFVQGMREVSPQAPGIAAWGLMTGVAMVKSGMSVFEASWVILATGFCVNLRFVVFSLHLRPYLMHLPRWQRMFHAYLTADISYVLFTRKFVHPGQNDAERHEQEAYLAGNDFLNWLSWIVASFVGIALANFIPPSWGLGFAGILCLLGIQCSLASSRMRILSAVVAGVAAVVAYSLPLKLNIVVAIAVAVILCLTVEKLRPAPGAAA
ncbi:MAG: inner membrane protein YgaZ [Pseudomonadota bacterium]